MKTFVEGEAIQFKRFSSHNPWEDGVYLTLDRGSPGWHWVKDAIGLRTATPIPNRRIRKVLTK